MADSFFGFDTSLPPDDDMGDMEEDELEYDALNDETFGSAINGDWEGIHENLVKLEDELKKSDGASRKPSREATSRSRYGGDLDINLSRVSLDDCFVESLDEPELPLKLDSSVWSSPQFNALSKDSKAPKPLNNASPRPKMFTVEDIERSIRIQPRGSEALGAPLHYTEPINRPMMPPPGLLPSPMSQPLFNVPPMAKQPMFRPPADFPLMHLMTSMGAPPMPRPLPPANMPQMAYNNLAMHSNFGGVRPPPMQGQPGRMNPLLNGPPFPTPPPPAPPMQSNPVSVNQYNKRLVQEIQQNHPMLYFNRLNNFDAGNNSYHPNQMNGSKNNNQNHQQQHRFKQQQQQQQQQHQRDGNLNLEEYDEYANLMSQRNKQWLIGIQLLQLNTETPYIDDYYYTVYQERRMKRERESKAHRDNQLNHPLTQPKGHQQLVLMSMGKNGTNQRSHERDKKNQERDKADKEMTPRTYTPLQFENSLGKLQCGSVTAPRKIIDMDIMGPDTTHQLTSNIELSTQKKSRQMLLHIESLYKIVLKVEDLKNPIAVATALVVKAKKERERKQAIDQLESDGEVERQAVLEAINDKFPEPDKLEDLLPQVVAGMSVDKVMGMMNVRKGRTLIKRSLPHLVDEEHKWQVWQAIFAVLPIIAKKDRDDADGSLGGLFTEFKNQLIVAKLSDFITVPKAIVAANKKLNYIFGNKFGMLSIIAMMLRVETIFQLDESELTSIDGMAWRQFVVTLAASAAKQPLTDTEQSLDKEILQILLDHLRRFPEVEAQPLTTSLSQVEFK
uniref:Uncharacterized protein n=1 Tax=Phlebotomus kandelakii TaxID=1109342 RepID=A0A6B2E8L0_9DIPT